MKDFPNYYGIFIKPVTNGFIVTVGCKKFVFNNPKELGTLLRSYFYDPAKTIEKLEKQLQISFGLRQTQEEFVIPTCVEHEVDESGAE